MATIQKRIGPKTGAISYRVLVRRCGHPPVSRTFKRKADADAFAAKAETAINEGGAGQLREARRQLMASAIDRYLSEVIAHRRDQSSRRHFEFWRKQLGHVRIGEVTSDQIVEAREALRRRASRRGGKLSPSTVRLYLASLSSLFSTARREWRWTSHNPVSDVTKPTPAPGRTRYLSAEERTALLAACRRSDDPRLYPFVLIALSTGARAGELYSLRWTDVDLERGEDGAERGIAILHRTKNRDRRSLPLRGAAYRAIKEMQTFGADATGFVFPPLGRARYMYERPFRAAVAAAKIQDFRFHDLRHSAASYLAMNGATASEIAAVLGHRTLAMVKRYAHLSDGHVGGIIERMNEKFIDG